MYILVEVYEVYTRYVFLALARTLIYLIRTRKKQQRYIIVSCRNELARNDLETAIYQIAFHPHADRHFLGRFSNGTQLVLL